MGPRSATIFAASGMIVCAVTYFGSVWMGNRPGVGEDLGPYLYSGIAGFFGFFIVPIVAFATSWKQFK